MNVFLICSRKKLKWEPASSRVLSPTQTTAVIPDSRMRMMRLLTVSSVSPAMRSSEWPAIAYSTPRLLSIAADTSPVCAPLSSIEADWAPSEKFLTDEREAAKGIKANGGHATTSVRERFEATVRVFLAIVLASSADAGFIFQLPMTRCFIAMADSISVFKPLNSTAARR